MTKRQRRVELQKVRSYLKNAEREINRLGIVTRTGYKFPFDILGLATLSKAFGLAKACLALLAAERPDEAYGLSRSLVECATNLRYLTAVTSEQNERCRTFVKFAKADKAFWYHYALASAKTAKEKSELRAYAKQEGVTDDTKLARQHWSGQGGGFVWNTTLADHPVDGARTEDFRKKAYAADYYQTSAFVHCSLPAIDNYFIEDEALFRVSESSPHRETHQSTLFIILIHVNNVIQYALYGLNTAVPARVDSLYESTLRKMKPVPTLHDRK